MRDYSNLLEHEICWKSEEEIKCFEKSYKPLIMSALKKKNIDDLHSCTIFDDILIKYASGKIVYDETMGKPETFLYRIAQNAAQDFLRERNRHQERETEIDDANTSHFYDFSLGNAQNFEYFRLITVETLKRLWQKVTRNKISMEIFTRRCFAHESIQDISDKYNKSKSEISVTASRMHSKFKKIFNEVELEMANDQMKRSPVSIDFLAPIMDFSLSISEIGELESPIRSKIFAA